MKVTFRRKGTFLRLCRTFKVLLQADDWITGWDIVDAIKSGDYSIDDYNVSHADLSVRSLHTPMRPWVNEGFIEKKKDGYEPMHYRVNPKIKEKVDESKQKYMWVAVDENGEPIYFKRVSNKAPVFRMVYKGKRRRVDLAEIVKEAR